MEADPAPAEPPARRLADRATRWARGQEAVRAALVYGSVARGSADAHSDLDLILVAEPGRRDELWAARATIATEILGAEPVWAHEPTWQRQYRYQAWNANGTELDLTVDEEHVVPWAALTRGFVTLIDRAEVGAALTRAMAEWTRPEFDAGTLDGGTWAWLLWLDRRLQHGELLMVRYGLLDTLANRVVPALGSVVHSAHRELDAAVTTWVHAAAPSSADPAELRRALAETALLYGWAIDRWAERTGHERPATPLREIALRRLRPP